MSFIPRLTLKQLRVFTAVAESGSTAAAAESVALSQSAASASLNELEDQLGLCLFDRVGRRLLLNESGRLLLPQALAVLDGARALEASARDNALHFGTLRIGASTTIGNYLLPELLARFRRSLPADAREAWHAQVTIANTRAITQRLARHDLDLALIEGPCHEAELDAQPWREDSLVVVCAPDDPMLTAHAGRPITLDALRAATWLLREAGSGTRETVDQALIPHLHQLREGFEFGTAEAIKRAVAHGLGISCLSRSVVADMLASGQLVVPATELPPIQRRFYIVLHRDKPRTPALGRLLTMLHNGDHGR